MRLLYPYPADIGELRSLYDVERPQPVGRPWVSLCMVSGLDGSTVVDHTSRGLSNPTDQNLLLALRTFADIVLVGAATVRHERYGPPKLPGQRIAVVTRSGDFDYTLPLFRSQAVVLVMPEDAPKVPVPSVRAGTGDIDIVGALGALHHEYGARVVQAEGGAALNGLLVAADVLDELNLTMSPQLNGGEGSRLTAGAPAVAHRMRLSHLAEDDGFLFGRWLRER